MLRDRRALRRPWEGPGPLFDDQILGEAQTGPLVGSLVTLKRVPQEEERNASSIRRKRKSKKKTIIEMDGPILRESATGGTI